VQNEKGETISNLPDFVPALDFLSYTSVIFRDKQEKYARYMDSAFIVWQRVAPLKVRALQNGTVVPASIELYRLLDGNSLLTKESTGSGQLNELVGEGLYQLRAKGGEWGLSTYYPAALLWEEAVTIHFTADEALECTIHLLPLPPAPSPADKGVISGVIKTDTTSVSQSSPVIFRGFSPVQAQVTELIQPTSPIEVYLKRLSDGSIQAIDTAVEQTYSFTQVPFGSYQVLVNVPGKPMIDKISVTLNEQHPSAQASYLIGANGIRASSPDKLTLVSTSRVILKQNPVTTRLEWSSVEGEEQVTILSLSGSEVMKGVAVNGSFDVSMLPKGLYVLQIQAEATVWITKFVKL
jgi:hypothetical protein